MSAEIWVVPFFGQGHLFPSIELCKQLASRNFKVTLLLSSNLSSNIPSSLAQYPSLHITQIPSSPVPGSHPHHSPHDQLLQGIENLLSIPPDNPHPPRPVSAVLDVMMSWTTVVFKKFEVPVVAFFTSSACSAASEYAIWKAHPQDLKPGEVRLLPGLPEEMSLSHSDIQREPHGPPRPPPPGAGAFFPPPPGGPRHHKMGPPVPGDQPPWVEEVSESIALLFNTCTDLEAPFIDYVKNQIGKPVWGVGPLLPEQYWKSAGGSLLHDSDVRKNRRSSITEDEVIQWLDSKPRGSVIYVSFGSEVSPTEDEHQELALALESTAHPFIWVRRSGLSMMEPHTVQPESGEEYLVHGLDSRVGGRGLIILEWAPQLLILSHPSTGGFLTHCGWNSTVEAMGCGIPFLVWPMRGDQHHNAKFLVHYMKIGYNVCDDLSKIKKDDITMGITNLMGDEEMKERAQRLSVLFQNGFPHSSVIALDAFKCHIYQKFI